MAGIFDARVREFLLFSGNHDFWQLSGFEWRLTCFPIAPQTLTTPAANKRNRRNLKTARIMRGDVQNSWMNVLNIWQISFGANA
jgi:hypothetical protein